MKKILLLLTGSVDRLSNRLAKRVPNLGFLRYISAAISLVALLFICIYLRNADFAVLHPAGLIAGKEHRLMLVGVLLSLIIIVPVFALTFGIVWKYRVGRKPGKRQAKKPMYTPDWDHDRRLETIWWGVPLVMILILSVITWRSSHDLDPFKPVSASISQQTGGRMNQPLTVQVVALQWKWLFIYPEQHIATVNYLEFPADTPINFQVTADAPMNSFWIPKLGGQIYAMSGMSTQLHLMADGPGEYRGVSANLSGEGFAGMTFKALSVPRSDFDGWIQNVSHTSPLLDAATYSKLSRPSKDNPPYFYALQTANQAASLYNSIIMKYMSPSGSSSDMSMQNEQNGRQDAQSGQPSQKAGSQDMTNMPGMAGMSH